MPGSEAADAPAHAATDLPRRLNVIGCGKAGRAVARLLHARRLCVVGDVANRTLASAVEAVAFIGAGTPKPDIAAMDAAGLWLVATGDDAIAPSAERLAASGRLRGGDIVFHLSGATASAALAPCRAAGASVASIHPVKNFSDPQASVRTFEGTWCGCEGDAAALALLQPAFERIGARLFCIDARYKALYHGGGAFACNFIPVLMELALRCEERAGIPREVALDMFEPIARETLDAVFRQGIAPALAGPISRGDAGTVARHLAAMDEWDPRVAQAYAQLGDVALDIVRSLGRVDAGRLDATRAAMRSAAATAQSTPEDPR
jgi:predicted short-subunit dehydrogenase-like oxidoreductase (DUF2520 family)